MIGELTDLLADHGEVYDVDGYHGCDCGFECSSLEHPAHVAGQIARWVS